jgi:hypothetical protein
MSVQLTFDFTPTLQRDERPSLQNETWLDVSGIARGVGFTMPVLISDNLNEALQHCQNEIDDNYDQRLYDCLWCAEFQLSLYQSQSTTFHFAFPRPGCKTEEVAEISLPVRAVVEKQVVLVGLWQDFSAAV